MKTMERKQLKSPMLIGANFITGKTGTGQATVLPAGPFAGTLPTKETT